MAIPIRLPSGRVITVKTDDPQAAARTARLIAAREAITAARPAPTSGFSDRAAAGATLGLADVEPAALTAGVTGLKNLAMQAAGKTPDFGMADAYSARRSLDKQAADKYTADHPGLSFTGGLLGGLAVPGASKIGDFVAGKLGGGATGFLGGLMTRKALPAVVARGAAVGGGLGAVSGAAEAKPGEEVQGAEQGGLLGGLFGGGLPAAAGLGARGAVMAKDFANSTVGTLAQGAMNLSGLQRSDVGQVATKQLLDALRAAKATPDQMRQILKDWQATGASAPSLLDLASKLPGGGGPVRRLIMGASLGDSGVGPAGQYAEKVATALPENADALVRSLTPNKATAAQAAQTLKGTQRGLAETTYKTPYEQPVEMTPQITDALADSHGVAAIKQAVNEATANRDYGRADRLNAFLKSSAGDNELPTFFHADGTPIQLTPFVMNALKARMPQAAEEVGLQAGDLDRVQIAFGKRAATQQSGEAGTARGLFQRQRDINDALDQVPGLSDARATYKGYQGRRDALDLGGEGLTSPSDDYLASLDEKIGMATSPDNPHPVSADDIKGDAGVGYRQAATNAINAPAAGASGAINKLATSPAQTAIQNGTFDPDVAARVREGLNNEMLRLANARRNNPGFGSGSIDRAVSLADQPKIPTSPTGAAVMAIAKLHAGAALTADERAAIVDAGLATTDPSGLIDQMHEDIHPIMDTIDEWARNLAPATGAATAQRAEATP